MYLIPHQINTEGRLLNILMRITHAGADYVNKEQRTATLTRCNFPSHRWSELQPRARVNPQSRLLPCEWVAVPAKRRGPVPAIPRLVPPTAAASFHPDFPRFRLVLRRSPLPSPPTWALSCPGWSLPSDPGAQRLSPPVPSGGLPSAALLHASDNFISGRRASPRRARPFLKQSHLCS